MSKLIGVVMTNQRRKEWGFTAQLCAEIVALYPDVTFWFHTDVLIRKWNIHAIVADYGLSERVTVTLPPMSDAWLASQYKACALTLLPSTGEGHGYPIFESFACDVPCLHTDYAGGASLMRTCGLQRYLVGCFTDGWRIEGQHNCLRPVLDLNTWLYKVGEVLGGGKTPGGLSEQVEHLRWSNLSGRWLNWFREGLA